MTTNDPSRRRFLRLAGLGAGAAVVGPRMGADRAQRVVDARAVARAVARTGAQDDILEIALSAVIDPVQLRPGAPTTLWRYRAAVTAGDPARVQALDGPFPGPIVRLHQGMRFQATFTNRLREDTTVHWHGLNVPWLMDGHPMSLVAPGATYTYAFEVRNPPGMYWFHPHPHGRTGTQVYRGLAGLLIVDEPPDDPRLTALPADLVELPLVVQDRTLDDVNALVYPQSVMGFLGDDVWVNGRERFTAAVERRPYRLRLLNGSNHRILKLGWRDGAPVRVIGTDGGLLDAPVDKPFVMMAPAERVEILADFRDAAPGEIRALDSLAFRDDSMAMGALWPQGGKAEVATFVVGGGPPDGAGRVFLPIAFNGRHAEAADFAPAPALAAPVCRIEPLRRDADPIPATRTIVLRLERGQFTLNGRTFEHDAVADDEIVKLGAEEVWAFVNDGAGMGPGMGMMMAGAHAMHVHLVRFRVVERTTDGRHAEAYGTVAAGYVDEGWKDTVLVMPGETVKVRMTFGDFTGLYLYHCHMLEHEDQGMMRNFRVDP